MHEYEVQGPKHETVHLHVIIDQDLTGEGYLVEFQYVKFDDLFTINEVLMLHTLHENSDGQGKYSVVELQRQRRNPK